MATIDDPYPKISLPSGHPADGMRLQVDVGNGAWMSIVDPRSPEIGGMCWALTWGDAEGVRYSAASLIRSYDYLLSSEISTSEAIRRLRLMRQTRALAANSTP